MAKESERRPNEVSGASERADAARSRKAWKTPFVITGTDVEDTEHGNAANVDAANAS